MNGSNADQFLWFIGAMVTLLGGLAGTGFLCACLLQSVIRYWGLTSKILRAWYYLETGKVPEKHDEGAY